MLYKLIIAFSCISVVFSFEVTIKNNGTESITVELNQILSNVDKVFSLDSNESIKVNFDALTIDEIYASKDENIGAVKTGGFLAHSPLVYWSYGVFLTFGYTVPLSITPLGGENCTIAECSIDLKEQCPEDNQIIDSSGNVVACTKNEELFSKLCPTSNTQYFCNADSLSVVYN